MGGTSTGSTNQAQTSTTTPASWATPYLQNSLAGIGNLGQPTSVEQGAFAGLESPQASGILAGYVPQQQNFAQTLYGGGQDFSGIVGDAYKNYLGGLSPFTSGSLNPYDTPGFADAINTARNDAFNQVGSSYAAAGRDPSGAGNFGQTFGRGFAQGVAPTIAAQYNTNVGNRLSSLGNAYQAGGNTAGLLSGLQQTKFGNQGLASTAAQTSQQFANSPFLQQLQAEAAKRGISMDAYLAQAGIALPAAQAFGTTTGTGTGNQTQQMSGAQQFATLATGASKLLPFAPMGAGALKGLLG